MVKYYNIAGLTISMDSYGRIEKQAIPYLSETKEQVDICIESFGSILKEKYPHITDDEAEYVGTGISFYRQLLNYNGIMLHSSAVVVDGKAYLFSAHSGTGKSTHTKLWLELFGEKAYILNDDKPALRMIDDTWYVFGTPWSGKNDLSVNEKVPLAGIAMLERAEKNKIERYTGKKAIFDIYNQVNKPKNMQFRVKVLECLNQLLTMVPVWKLSCNMDLEAAKISYEAMSKERSVTI